MRGAGPLIVLTLGAVTGVLFHLLWRRFWVASAAATAASSVLWVGVCYLLFALTAPSELGPLALVPILFTLVTAFAGSIAAGGALRTLRAR